MNNPSRDSLIRDITIKMKEHNMNSDFFKERSKYMKDNTLLYIFDNIDKMIINNIENVPDFLSYYECQQLILLGENRYSKSMVATQDGNTNNSKLRSSKICYFSKSENDFILGVETKIANLLNVDISQIEPLKLNKYSKGDVFNYHYDFFPEASDNERK